MSDVVPLTGEPLALDLINTRTSAGDLLATPDDLRNWLRIQAGRLPDTDPADPNADPDAEPADAAAVAIADAVVSDVDAAVAVLRAVRAVREHAARAVERARHGERPADADLAALNAFQRAAPAVTEVSWNGSAVAAERRRVGPAEARLAARLAEAAADLLADPSVTRIRQCEADDCVLLFLPVHPRRRWCSAARCGNRVRVARHYQRRHHDPA